MELTDLTIAFIGDSITEGIGATSKECSFPSVFEINTDIKKAFDLGAHSVVIGSAITRPKEIVKRYIRKAKV